MLGFIIFLIGASFFVPLILSIVNSKRGKEVIRKRWKFDLWLAVSGMAGLILVMWILSVYTEVLWFANLNYVSVFWTMFAWKWSLFLFFGIIGYSVLQLNAWIVKRIVPDIPEDGDPNIVQENIVQEWKISSRIVDIAGTVICLLIAFLMALWAETAWDEVLMYLNQVVSGTTEPIFQKDISFYLFSLPVFRFISSWLLILSILTLAGVASLYRFYYARAETVFFGEKETQAMKEIKKQAIVHSSLIGVALTLVLIWITVIAIYKLLYSNRGVVFGASYADINAQILAYWIFIVILATAALALIVGIFRPKKGLIAACSACVVLVSWWIVVLLYPVLVQQLVVKPNELEKEIPYIKHNIAFTRQAYKIAEVDEREFDVSTEITPEVLARNRGTLDNIRIWDWRALKDTYRQIQAIRLYYEFFDIDIDRYMLDGRYRQVMLAVRELDKDRLPKRSRTWINEKFKYTHGYGLCLNLVNEFMPGGLPNLLIKDIPPVSSMPGTEIAQPEVYYGERTLDHVFVKTGEEEFDYPQGDENAYSSYKGRGGVSLSSWLRKLAYALRFDGIRVLLAKHLKPESRIMFHRQIQERIKTIAPFLWYDRDPYVVIDKSGRQLWIQDAYTISENYPYSEPTSWVTGSSSFNYIRNSVKVVVDQYNGQVSFYVFDPDDPVVRTYQNVFPDLFRSRDEMPADLQKHIRYPEDFLSIQAKMYAVYHMENPPVFYNREDQWEFANETYAGGRQLVLPYYIIVRLPGEEKEEFLQMIPFTPYTPPKKEAERKDNMIGWLAARCDGDHYGKLLVYKFSKEEMIAGPMQVESWIDQNTDMSEKLTLWGQKGSEVIRGNLLVIPIENSLLYVEPLYLQAERGKMPQIKKVSICRGVKGEVVWGDNFETALKQIVAGIRAKIPKERIILKEAANLEDLIQSAVNHFERYLNLTGKGELNQAGQELEQLRRDLEILLRNAERK